MTLRQYISIMIVATLFCWLAWVMVIMNVDPFEASPSMFIFFYLSLFLALFGMISLILFGAFRLFGRGEFSLYRYVQKSFVDALAISVFLVALLYMQSLGYLHYWNLGILFAIMVFLGLFRISTKRSRHATNN
jgi:hypothetical protein